MESGIFGPDNFLGGPTGTAGRYDRGFTVTIWNDVYSGAKAVGIPVGLGSNYGTAPQTWLQWQAGNWARRMALMVLSIINCARMAATSAKNRFERFFRFTFTIRGSLILSVILIFLDVVFTGSYLFSFVICPIWLVVALIRKSLGHADRQIAVARIFVPVVTGFLVFGNYIFQMNIANAHAALIIQACEHYREANGAYPKNLDELIPDYLSSIPTAKYCCVCNHFLYYGVGSPHSLF